MNTISTRTRRQVLVGLGAAGAASLAGCTGGDGQGSTATPTATPTPEPAMLRVVHASPNAPAVDVWVDGEPALEGVDFGAVSAYLTLPAGSHAIEITAAGDADASVFSGDVALAADTAYSVVAAGELGDDADEPFAPLVLTDDVSAPADGNARVTLVHTSPDAPAVDVTLPSGDVLFAGVAFGDSGAIEVPAGEYTIQVRGATEDNDGDVVAQYVLDLQGGTVYSGFAAGYLTPDDEPADTPFRLLLATTEGAAGTAPTPEAPAEPASLRVVHASPNAPAVDVYVDGSAILEDVPFGAVSDYLDVPAGTYAVEITAAGDPDAVVFSGDVPVEAATDYTIVAAGELGDAADEAFAPLVLTDDNAAPGDDTARVRVVHASPDAPAVDVTAGDAVLFDGVPYGGAGYVEVPAGDYTLDIRGDTESNDGDAVASYDLSLSGGAVYTALAVGYLTPDDEPAATAFDLVVAQDA